jgi:hypothetical protein
VEIDQNNVIQNYSFYGNLGGCQRYANVVKATDEIRASDSTQYDLASTWTNDARQFARWKEASAAARERCGHVCYEEINACMKYSSVDGAVRCLDLIAAE